MLFGQLKVPRTSMRQSPSPSEFTWRPTDSSAVALPSRYDPHHYGHHHHQRCSARPRVPPPWPQQSASYYTLPNGATNAMHHRQPNVRVQQLHNHILSPAAAIRASNMTSECPSNSWLEASFARCMEPEPHDLGEGRGTGWLPWAKDPGARTISFGWISLI